MSDETIKPLSTSDLSKPSAAFMRYCEKELERRRNKDDDFDEVSFLEAMQLTVNRLQMIEDEEQL